MYSFPAQKRGLVVSWNFRILRYYVDNPSNPAEPFTAYRIAEVYYDKDTGEPRMYSDRDYNPLTDWDDLGDLIGTCEKVLAACQKPVLDEQATFSPPPPPSSQD